MSIQSKTLFIVFGLVFLLTQSAQALTWLPSPDGNVSGSPETTLTLGVSDVGLDEWDTASAGIFGVAANLGIGFINHTVTLSADYYSWDSYNATWGYGDVFLLALTEKEPYWNLPVTHPVEGDPQLIWPSGSVTAWGGDKWSDGILGNLSDSGSFLFNVDPAKDYYLNIILDTSNGGEFFPSWGYVSQLQVQSTPVPEPATLMLVGAGLAVMGLLRLRRKN